VKLYRESDLGIRDKAIFEISRADSVKFATIEAYTSEIKVANQTLNKIGLILPKWVLNSYFRIGLKESLVPLLFSII